MAESAEVGQTVAATRSYRSVRRERQAAETRALVLRSAHRLFVERGWAATVRDIARAAGVAVETVYAGFGSKTDLLAAVLDVAIAGDDRPVPIAQRPEFAAIGAGRSMTQRATAAARLMRQIHERTNGVEQALRQGAATDASLAERARRSDENRRSSVADGATLIARRQLSSTERDGVWALLSPEVYHLLVHRSGWSPSLYEHWAGEALTRLLRAPSTKPAATQEGKR